MCPYKKGRRGRRDGMPLDGSNEEDGNTDNGGDASSDSDGDSTDEEGDGGLGPPPDLKADARLDSLRRDNAILQAVVREQDRVLAEMEQRTREIQAATAQRRAELDALRAARERRAAAAAAEEGNGDNGKKVSSDEDNDKKK